MIKIIGWQPGDWLTGVHRNGKFTYFFFVRCFFFCTDFHGKVYLMVSHCETERRSTETAFAFPIFGQTNEHMPYLLYRPTENQFLILGNDEFRYNIFFGCTWTLQNTFKSLANYRACLVYFFSSSMFWFGYITFSCKICWIDKTKK